MKTHTIKISGQLQFQISQAGRCTHPTKSELARRAPVAGIAGTGGGGSGASAVAEAGDFVGCFKGGPKDLASNPKHMEGFGRK